MVSTCNFDFAYDVKAQKKSLAICIMAMAMKPGPVKRAHELLKDGTHIIDQKDRLKIINQSGNKTNVVLREEGEMEILDLVSMKGKSRAVVMLVKGAEGCGVMIHYLGEDNFSEEKLYVKFDEGQTGIKVESRVSEDGTNGHIIILLSNGSLLKLDEGACLAISSTPTLSEALKADAATRVKEDVHVKDFTLSTDGKLYLILSKEGSLITLNEKFETTCEWKSETEISNMRVVPALKENSSVISHNVIVWGNNTLVLYHIKAKNETWYAWKTQTVTLRGFEGSRLLEVGSWNDVVVVVSQDKAVLVAMRLSGATTSGRHITGINSFDCDAAFGTFVSMVIKSEKAGVRCSSRRTEGLFLHDIAFDDISSLHDHNERVSRNMDDLSAQVKRLTRENKQLKEENQMLQAKKGQEIPKEFEVQLKETTKMVEETCRALMTCHKDISERIRKLEEDLRMTQQMQEKNIKRSEEQLETATKQVQGLVRESAEEDVKLIKQLQVHVTQGLAKVQEDAVKEYQKLIENSQANRVRETTYLKEQLQKTTQSLLSEPGLARLKTMVTKSAFSPKESEAEEEAIKQAINESIRGELKKHLESTAKVFLEQERDALNKQTTELITKANGLVTNVSKDISNELKLGLEKLSADTEASADSKWQQQADSRLRDLFTEGLEIVAKMGNTTPAAVELLLAKKKVKAAIENEDFWRAGLPEVLQVSDGCKLELLNYVCEVAGQHIPANNPPVTDVVVQQNAINFAILMARNLSGTMFSQKLQFVQAALDVSGSRPSPTELGEVIACVRAHQTTAQQLVPNVFTRILTKCNAHPHYH